MAHFLITAELPNSSIAELRTKADRSQQLRILLSMLGGLLLGRKYKGYVRMTLCSARASQLVTASASGGAPNDTLVIAGTTLTNKASPANENEFADAATDALLAASAVACINAHSVLSKIVFAVVTGSAAGEFRIYSKIPGPLGNLITLAETGSGFVLTGAVLASGSGDEMDEINRGYDPRTALAG